ncbi:unnamed protein product [Hymenolepis diminuta]|uniref:Uncharacterized protein n=1 Tax=Hymenolepis diminuta TaxID=6216 RepID=A0A564XYB4_HYMDI|nr:unnamed protein product [Hymenolepis diminuta]
MGKYGGYCGESCNDCCPPCCDECCFDCGNYCCICAPCYPDKPCGGACYYNTRKHYKRYC